MNTARKFFYLLLLLLPVQLGRHFWPPFSFVSSIRIDYLAPKIYLTDIILLTLLALWLFHDNVRNQIAHTLRSNKILVTAIIVSIFFNILLAANPWAAGIKMLTLVKLALFTWYIVDTKPPFRRVSLFLFIATLWSALIAWGQFMEQRSIGGALWLLGERSFSIGSPGIALSSFNGINILRPYATFPHPNVLAGFIVVVFPLIAVLLFNQKVKSFIRIPTILFIVITLLITFSRSAWIVAIFIGLITVALTIGSARTTQNNPSKRPSPIMLLGLLGIITWFAPLIYQRFTKLVTGDMQSIVQRIHLNSIAREMIRAHPVIGVGLNNFLTRIPDYSRITSYLDLQPAHNTYLLIAAETGIIGLGFTVYGLGLLALRITRKSIRLDEKSIAIILSFLSILMLSIVDHYFYTIHQTQLLAALVIGMCIAVYND